MQLPAVLGILGLAVSTAAKITFINPPQFTRKVQVTEHDVWVTGQTIDIRWSQPDEGKKLSVVLYQMNSTMAASFNGQFPGADPPFEYITHDQVGATFFRWIVGTTKDLRFSNQFAIAVWAEGTVVTDSATNIFNITSAATLPDDTSCPSTAESHLNALISLVPEKLPFERVHLLDGELRLGHCRGPLHGIPVILKDCIATGPELGMPTSAGSVALLEDKITKNAPPPLLTDGAVIVGKSKLSELCAFK
ncbi:hypothetical protein B0T14DRAFT_566067 [Immersiella caudata]|uniref:Amidase domain-containing protein n=1 Tax=Immersiella caudata TaxID=314043 RepID=A0AA40BZ69_9PEZI|nr:hypothetical protein B0T14DRAFT_566067 [Immersiella caudata]